MNGVLVADIGGTHARFAIATCRAGRTSALGAVATLSVAGFDSLEAALERYRQGVGWLPERAVLAVAAPVADGPVRLTNGPWVIDPARLAATFGFASVGLLNDVEAIAHAVAAAPRHALPAIAGPDRPLPAKGVVTVIAPGTGLGAALIWREGRRARVLATEAGHIGLAPHDGDEDMILQQLRGAFGRVSVERMVSGPGLARIHTALAARAGTPAPPRDDAALWAAALAGADPPAREALSRWCLAFGSLAGDLALAHGAKAVVLAGSLANRLADHLPASGFHARFLAKGRYATLMAGLPIRRLALDEPGLHGAAVAAFPRAGR
ncbi:glucokinase [Thermaurantiacus sp.]